MAPVGTNGLPLIRGPLISESGEEEHNEDDQVVKEIDISEKVKNEPES